MRAVKGGNGKRTSATALEKQMEKADKQLGRETTTTVLLKKLLADTYILALKTQGFHWNVTGRDFAELHALFEEQYTELFAAGDEIAERLRALRMPALGSFAEFSKYASIREATADVLRAKQMVAALVADNEQMSRLARQLATSATAVDDVASADLGVRRANAHDKAAWMLRATLEDDIRNEAR